jgi:nickel superoxide dismutase
MLNITALIQISMTPGTSKEDKMKKLLLWSAAAVAISFFAVGSISAHCEIPCGIYDDQLRIKMIYEHTLTIEKAMNEIIRLGKDNAVDYNQLIRWVSNKEAHASEIQHIVSQYFMTQRINIETEKYEQKLTILHKILRTAMRCKQSTDLKKVERIRGLLTEFETLYFGKKK